MLRQPTRETFFTRDVGPHIVSFSVLHYPLRSVGYPIISGGLKITVTEQTYRHLDLDTHSNGFLRYNKVTETSLEDTKVPNLLGLY